MASEIKYLTLYEASVFLERHAKESRKANMWFGYLKHNAVKYMEQDGCKVVSHVIEGKLHYTVSALKAFIKVLGSKAERKEIESILNAVDKPKRNKPFKPKQRPGGKKPRAKQGCRG